MISFESIHSSSSHSLPLCNETKISIKDHVTLGQIRATIYHRTISCGHFLCVCPSSPSFLSLYTNAKPRFVDNNLATSWAIMNQGPTQEPPTKACRTNEIFLSIKQSFEQEQQQKQRRNGICPQSGGPFVVPIWMGCRRSPVIPLVTGGWSFVRGEECVSSIKKNYYCRCSINSTTTDQVQCHCHCHRNSWGCSCSIHPLVRAFSIRRIRRIRDGASGFCGCWLLSAHSNYNAITVISTRGEAGGGGVGGCGGRCSLTPCI